MYTADPNVEWLGSSSVAIVDAIVAMVEELLSVRNG